MAVNEQQDVIVVGAGSAGCVVASRLSQHPDRRVLLLEAGPDYPTRSQLPVDVADASCLPSDRSRRVEGPNLPTMMLAERLAARLAEQG